MDKEYHLGLIGYPIQHSLSPLLHRAALKATGIRGDYQLFPVEGLPQGNHQLKMVIEKLNDGELDGVNVTIPHKQNVIAYVDALSNDARCVGAVNTLYKRDGLLQGENTDVKGFIHDLHRIGVKNGENRLACVLGAGGGARAVIWGLLNSGWRVYILARNLEKSQSLIEGICANGASVYPDVKNKMRGLLLDPQVIKKLIEEEAVHLIVNATPLGMTSHPSGSAWPADIPLPKDAVVYDLVYTPPVTELIRQAQHWGVPAFNGLGMLVEQAALAFEIWTGIPAPRGAMWKQIHNLDR